jgi:hypothetical protein
MPCQLTQRDLVSRSVLGDERFDDLAVAQPSLRAHVDAIEATRVSRQRSIAGAADLGWIGDGRLKGS